MTKVIPFPGITIHSGERPTPQPLPTLAWYRCAGGCGALVSGQHAVCLSCAVEDRE